MLGSAFPELSAACLRMLTQWAELVRDAAARDELSSSISARGLLAMCTEIMDGATLEQARDRVYSSRLLDDAEVACVASFWERVKPSNAE